MEQDYIKLIFGLKLKQIRTERGISLFGLSKLTGLSKSYLNEIEKGKKYPKTDKILLLAEQLEVPYDHMVSLKLDKNLAPVGRILRGKILREIPLEHFGIQESTLIDIIANAPAKVNAFINTIIKIAQDYSFTRESFYLASLRSLQEANNNYFDVIENEVLKFAKAYHIDLNTPIKSNELEDILVEEFGYTINKTALDDQSHIEGLRSIFVPKTKTLLISSHLDDPQCTFIYAKEIAFNYLNYKERLYTFSWIKFDNFDQVLNNFYASYFAGALLIPKITLSSKIKQLLEQSTFNTKDFLNLIENYNASSETFYQRLTNILPKDYNLLNLFFIRFSHQKGNNNYHIEKELHLINNLSEKEDETKELFCRRWVGVSSLNKAITRKKNNHTFRVNVLSHPKNKCRYLVFTSTTIDENNKNHHKSICLGLLIDKQLERKVAFLEDSAIKESEVNLEKIKNYSIFDSQNRIEQPIALEQLTKNKAIENTVNAITDKFS
ncbi:XRE family transcriptional regulator [Winogradskyella sp.]|jgi:transcriptional regulator with XRE-family HTH domain|uniref:helix-turn-helix domain-containing protein n=1 Tax=Winogradskyella sp. TaxID=1883156 RepID=UPI0025F2BF37|nr:XRE family transcriptional regulator [Winogradskyella sp.]MCT4629313.1 XRE family transcriptional regulator [Winogradskyella sp.]